MCRNVAAQDCIPLKNMIQIPETVQRTIQKVGGGGLCGKIKEITMTSLGQVVHFQQVHTGFEKENRSFQEDSDTGVKYQ